MATKKTSAKAKANATAPSSAETQAKGAGSSAGPAAAQASADEKAPEPEKVEEPKQEPKKEQKPADEIEALFVRTTRQANRRRAGLAFGPTPYGIALDALTEEQIQAIESDPHLVVERGFVSADEEQA